MSNMKELWSDIYKECVTLTLIANHDNYPYMDLASATAYVDIMLDEYDNEIDLVLNKLRINANLWYTKNKISSWKKNSDSPTTYGIATNIEFIKNEDSADWIIINIDSQDVSRSNLDKYENSSIIIIQIDGKTVHIKG